LRAEGCDMALPLLCCGMAHPLDVGPAGPAPGMRDPPGSVRGIPRLEPEAGSALQLVRDLTADAFVKPKKQHRLRLLPSREAVSVFLGGSRLMRAEGSALSLQSEDASRRRAARPRPRGARPVRRIAQAGSPLER
jgi:hypothetical protein